MEQGHKQEINKILKTFSESFSEVFEAAIKDEKTKLYNHRFFKSVFEIELEVAKRKKQPLSLAIIDIDFFKKLNDTYGHLVGDEVLITLARVMKKFLRKYDILSRFGGEEFFVLMQETSIEQAKKIMERLRKSLWKNTKLKKYRVAISVGVTSYKLKDNMERMIKRADKSLYKSKKQGRNQVNIL